MSPLADMQSAFVTALQDPSHPIPSAVRQPGHGDQSRRFDVYRNNVAVSLTEALADAFPVTRKLVGDDFFGAAARTYIDQAPPTSPVLLLYGETFGAFLDAFTPARQVPYIADVARLEWSWLKAFHAQDSEPLGLDVLADLSADTIGAMCFTPHPSMTLIRSRWPVASIWQDVTGNGDPIAVDMTQGEDIALVRPKLSVEVRILPEGGYAFMDALAGGAPLADAAEAATHAAPKIDLSVHLQGIFTLGAFVGASHPSQAEVPHND